MAHSATLTQACAHQKRQGTSNIRMTPLYNLKALLAGNTFRRKPVVTDKGTYCAFYILIWYIPKGPNHLNQGKFEEHLNGKLLGFLSKKLCKLNVFDLVSKKTYFLAKKIWNNFSIYVSCLQTGGHTHAKILIDTSVHISWTSPNFFRVLAQGLG